MDYWRGFNTIINRGGGTVILNNHIIKRVEKIFLVLITLMILGSVFIHAEISNEDGFPCPNSGIDPSNYYCYGDTVYVNTTPAYISVKPHTLPNSGYQNITIKSHTYTGDMNVLFGFDSDGAKPSKAYLYKPRNITWEDSYDIRIQNVWSAEVSLSPCMAGSENSPIKRLLHFETFNMTIDNQIDQYYNLSKVWCADTVTPDGTGIYNLTMHSDRYEWKEWLDITSKFNSFNANFNSKDKFYYLKDVPIVAGEEYLIKALINIPIKLGNYSSKFDMMVYPSTYGNDIIGAYQSGNSVLLDPWYDSNWGNKKNITLTFDSVQTNYQTNISVDTQTLISAGKMQSDCDDIRITNYTDDLMDFVIVNGTCNTTNTEIWIEADVLINGDRNFFMYYNYSGATAGGSESDTFIDVIPNLAAAFEFEKIVGEWTNDTSGLGLNAKIHNATTTTAGKFGSAFNFDGNNDWLWPESPWWSEGDDLTVVAWVNLTDNTTYHKIVDAWRGDIGGNWLIAFTGANEPTWGYGDLTGELKMVDSSQPRLLYTAGGTPTDTWVHAGFSWESATGNIYAYKNGDSQLVAGDIGDQIKSTNGMCIGAGFCNRPDPNDDMNGIIDEIFGFTTALSSVDINTIYDYRPFVLRNTYERLIIRKGDALATFTVGSDEMESTTTTSTTSTSSTTSTTSTSTSTSTSSTSSSTSTSSTTTSTLDPATIHYLRIYDITGHGYNFIDVYQNNNVSKHYIKTINIRNSTIKKILAINDYSLYVKPNKVGVFGSISNSKTVDYIGVNLIWFVLIGVIFIVLYTYINREK